MDSAKLEDTFDKQYMSTIYWNPWPILMKHVFEFYTSDLPGNYRIRLEGVAENRDLFYGEKMITVREK